MHATEPPATVSSPISSVFLHRFVLEFSVVPGGPAARGAVASPPWGGVPIGLPSTKEAYICKKV